MINVTLQSVNVGNLVTLKSSAVFKNGYIAGVGTKLSDEVYTAVAPATASLATAPLVIVFNDETTSLNYENITAGSNLPAGTLLRGYYLTAGDRIIIDNDLLTGSAAVNKFLIPANGSNLLAVADDLTGGTRLALEIKAETTIGFNKRQAWEAVVVSA